MKIVILTGSTGVGKTTIAKELEGNTILLGKTPYTFKRKVSHTSRKPREDEVDGIAYNFVDKDYFEDNREDFIELEEIYGELYGCTDFKKERNAIYLREMGYEGAKAVKSMYSKDCIILDITSTRIVDKGRDIKRRCEDVLRRMPNIVDYEVSNDGDINHTLFRVIEILEERWKVSNVDG